MPASSVRLNEISSRVIAAEDRVLVLAQMAIEVAHRGDDDLRRLGQERLRSPEQPAVPDGAPDDPSHDVAPALVRRQHAVREQERVAREWSAMTW